MIIPLSIVMPIYFDRSNEKNPQSNSSKMRFHLQSDRNSTESLRSLNEIINNLINKDFLSI